MDFDNSNSGYETADAFGGYARGGGYGNGNIPEIDTIPYHSDASNPVPEEIPIRDPGRKNRRAE